ncbi:unnamed protein product [Calypogeia fissa]
MKLTLFVCVDEEAVERRAGHLNRGTWKVLEEFEEIRRLFSECLEQAIEVADCRAIFIGVGLYAMTALDIEASEGGRLGLERMRRVTNRNLLEETILPNFKVRRNRLLPLQSAEGRQPDIRSVGRDW